MAEVSQAADPRFVEGLLQFLAQPESGRLCLIAISELASGIIIAEEGSDRQRVLYVDSSVYCQKPHVLFVTLQETAHPGISELRDPQSRSDLLMCACADAALVRKDGKEIEWHDHPVALNLHG